MDQQNQNPQSSSEVQGPGDEAVGTTNGSENHLPEQVAPVVENEASVDQTADEAPTADLIVEAPNVTQTDAIYSTSEVNGLINVEKEDYIAVLQNVRKTTSAILETNRLAQEESRASTRWLQIITSAFSTYPQGSQFESTVEREGSDFQQAIVTEKGSLSLARPRFSESGPKLRGEAALIRMRALLGMGSLTTVPLVHTGVWVTLKTPSDSALLEIRRRLMEDKITLGRQTHGLVFSNVQSYSNGWLYDLVLDHVYSMTLKGDVEQLRELINVNDLMILFWGLAASIWPAGFNYVRADMTKEGIEEKRFHKGLIDVNKLLWVDNSALTPAQKAHMSNRVPNTVTLEQVKNYQNAFSFSQGRSVMFGEPDEEGQYPIKVNLGLPTALEFIKSGHRWISSLAEIIERTFTGDREDYDGRNQAIVEHANATIMRQYGHWIKSIEVAGEEQTEPDTLDAMINSLAENPDVRKKIMEEVSKFIDDVTIAVIALPESNTEFKGPKRFPRLIPMDVVAVFFTLLMQRTSRMLPV